MYSKWKFLLCLEILNIKKKINKYIACNSYRGKSLNDLLYCLLFLIQLIPFNRNSTGNMIRVIISRKMFFWICISVLYVIIFDLNFSFSSLCGSELPFVVSHNTEVENNMVIILILLSSNGLGRQTDFYITRSWKIPD